MPKKSIVIFDVRIHTTTLNIECFEKNSTVKFVLREEIYDF